LRQKLRIVPSRVVKAQRDPERRYCDIPYTYRNQSVLRASA